MRWRYHQMAGQFTKSPCLDPLDPRKFSSNKEKRAEMYQRLTAADHLKKAVHLSKSAPHVDTWNTVLTLSNKMFRSFLLDSTEHLLEESVQNAVCKQVIVIKVYNGTVDMSNDHLNWCGFQRANSLWAATKAPEADLSMG